MVVVGIYVVVVVVVVDVSFWPRAVETERAAALSAIINVDVFIKLLLSQATGEQPSYVIGPAEVFGCCP